MSDLVIHDLCVDRNGRPILAGCNAIFPAGRRTVLWGRSGAGKSTLLAAIAGLMQPRRGRIALGSNVLFSADGVDVPPHRRRIGYVFQDLALWPHLSAVEQVHVVGKGAGRAKATASELLESVGLHGLAHRRPGELSGGEQQRLAIARALASEPSILLLDEPLSSVDRTTRTALYSLIQAVASRLSGPTLYVTHDPEDAEHLAECAFQLMDGKLSELHTPWAELR